MDRGQSGAIENNHQSKDISLLIVAVNEKRMGAIVDWGEIAGEEAAVRQGLHDVGEVAAAGSGLDLNA